MISGGTSAGTGRAGTVLHSIRHVLDTDEGWRGRLLRASWLALPIFLFLAITFGNPPEAMVAAIYFRDPILVILILAALAGAYHVRGWLGIGVALAATLFLFAVELAGFWASAASNELVIGGLLPWSDAEGYHRGAELLSEGLELQPWHGRRPLFVAALAVLLTLTGHHLQIAIAVLVLITATASFLLARHVRASLGALAAAIVVLFLWTFYGGLVGSTMSEHLGLSLGTLALAALWEGSRVARLNLLWFAGLWLLTVALTARAGAFLVLPVLLAWAFLHACREGSLREGMRVLALGIAAICAGFVVDAIVRLILVPEAMPFGNFSRTLYGVVVGNKGWLQIARDHPELRQLGDSEANHAIYRLAFEAIRERPDVALRGLVSTWRDYFSFGGGLFCFVTASPVQIACVILAALGFCRCVLCWREPRGLMVLAMVAGVILSVPFVPPLDSRCMQVHAATMPALGLLLAHGAVLPWRRRSDHSGDAFSHLAPVIGVALVLLSAGGAILLHFLREASPVVQLRCQPGHESLAVRARETNLIRLVNPAARNDLPELRTSDFRNGLGIYRQSYPELHHVLMELNVGDELRWGIDLTQGGNGRPLWLITRTGSIPNSGIVTGCAEPAGTVEHHRFHRFPGAGQVDQVINPAR